MKLLITPAEIAEMAFGGVENVASGALGEGTIASAQNRYVKPVLGAGLYAALEQGRYPELLDEWIKPALAQFVKFTVLPSLSAQIGTLGVVMYEGVGFTPADKEAVKLLLRRVRTDAESLLAAAVDHIESVPAKYPEYVENENVKNRVSMIGGVML